MKVRVLVKSTVTESILSSTSFHESSSISFTTTVNLPRQFSHVINVLTLTISLLNIHIHSLERKSKLITVGFKD